MYLTADLKRTASYPSNTFASLKDAGSQSLLGAQFDTPLTCRVDNMNEHNASLSCSHTCIPYILECSRCIFDILSLDFWCART